MKHELEQDVESPAGFIVSYDAPRKYNPIQTHIKGMINLVNFTLGIV